ncbi:MAG: hypothetical protein V2B18_09205 [Pseudomonadota bacterium]
MYGRLDHPAMECVDSFMQCIMALDESPKNPAKAKAQAFLAVMPHLVKSVGIGALRGYWDLDSPELDDLKAFLEALR